MAGSHIWQAIIFHSNRLPAQPMNCRTIWTYWENKTGKHTPGYINLCHETVRKTNPDCLFVVLSPENLRHYLPPLSVAIDNLIPKKAIEPSLALKADIIRVQILKAHGGIWIDSDCIALGRLGHLFEILERKGFFAIDKSGPNGVFYANNLIGSAPGGNIISAYADEQVGLVTEKQRFGATYDWTELGSTMLTRVVQDHLATDFEPLDEALYHPLGFQDHEKFLLIDYNGSTRPELDACHTVMLYNNLFPDSLKGMTEQQLLASPTMLGSILRSVITDRPKDNCPSTRTSSRKPVGYRDIALIFSTLRRPESSQLFVASVRRYLPPEITIHIAVQGDDLTDYQALQNSPGMHLYPVPEDYGLSASRNLLLDNTDEPVIFLCDDDFLVTPRTRLDVALAIWNDHPEIKILGGMFENFNYSEDGELTNRRYTSFDHKIVDHKLLPDTKIFIPQQYLAKEHHYVDETHYFYYTDTVNNFALMDRAFLDETGLRWDDDLKISGEHEDFYLALHRGNAASQNAVAFTNALFVEHHRHTNPAYKSKRERKQFHIRSMEKSSSKTWVFLGKRIESVESGNFREHKHPRNK
ncbi:capsular polysaccharide synthesis protein [Hoeflea sp. CAU 1731]